MTGLKVGDCVRFLGTDVIGTVDRVWMSGTTEVIAKGSYFIVPAEVLEVIPKPVKAGDILTTVRELENLPLFAVVKSVGTEIAAAARSTHGWYHAGPSASQYLSYEIRLPVKVLYLPES